MPESFLVLFNSQGSNVIDNTNKNKVIYEVDWEAFLPKKIRSFIVNLFSNLPILEHSLQIMVLSI